MRSNLKNKIILSAIVAALIIGGLSFFVWYLQKETKDIRKLNSEIETLESQQGDLGAKVREAKSVRDKLDSHFIDSAEIVSVVEQIESRGEEVGVSAEVSSIQEAEDAVEFEMKAKGERNALVTYFSQIESLPYFAEISDVFLFQKDSETWEIIIKVKGLLK